MAVATETTIVPLTALTKQVPRRATDSRPGRLLGHLVVEISLWSLCHGVSVEHERRPPSCVFQTSVISITKGTDLALQDLVDRVHGRSNRRIWLPSSLHENTKGRTPTGVDRGSLVAMYDELRMIQPVHAIVGKIERADLPQKQPERVHIRGQIIRLAASDFRSHVAQRAGVSRQLIVLGTTVLKLRVKLFGKSKVKNLDIA